MLIKRLSHVSAAVAIFGMSAAADAQTWSLEQLAKQALASHPAVLSKRSAAVAAQASVSVAEWQRYPPGNIDQH